MLYFADHFLHRSYTVSPAIKGSHRTKLTVKGAAARCLNGIDKKICLSVQKFSFWELETVKAAKIRGTVNGF